MNDNQQSIRVSSSAVPSDIANDDEKLNASIRNLISFVPRSIIPGEKTQELLGIADYVSKLNLTETVENIKDYFFNNQAIGCDNRCLMAKVIKPK